MILLAFFGMIPPVFWQAESAAPNWTITRNEIIWRTRYTNCPRGYSVDLPPGVVAHSPLPSVPSHGFVVSPRNPQKTTPIALESERLLTFDDQNVTMDLPNPKAVLFWEIANTFKSHLISLRSFHLQGLSGLEGSYSYELNGKPKIATEFRVFRKTDDLVYAIRLTTDPSHYDDDLRLYTQIRQGFKVVPLPSGSCVNP